MIFYDNEPFVYNLVLYKITEYKAFGIPVGQSNLADMLMDIEDKKAARIKYNYAKTNLESASKIVNSVQQRIMELMVEFELAKTDKEKKDILLEAMELKDNLFELLLGE